MPPVIKRAEPESAWVESRVSYQPPNDRKRRTATALVRGPWAIIHDEKSGEWDLYHLRCDAPTAIGLSSQEDAQRIADWLWKTIPLIMRLSSTEEMREKLEVQKRTLLNDWVKRCEGAKKFLAPPSLN